MSASRIFLDANILIEIILGREKEGIARKLIASHSGHLYISALGAHLVTHFGQAIVELSVLRQFLADYTILTLDAVDFEWAFTNIQGADFEDALQLAVAVRNGCDQFVTFDKGLVGAYKDNPIVKIRLAA